MWATSITGNSFHNNRVERRVVVAHLSGPKQYNKEAACSSGLHWPIGFQGAQAIGCGCV